MGERNGRLSLPRGLGPKQGHDLGVGPLTSGASATQHLLGTRGSWRVSRAQLDPPVSLAPGSKPFPVHSVSACLDQGGEVPATLTTPRDRLVTVPPGTRGQASSQTAHLLSSGSERSCRGRGVLRGCPGQPARGQLWQHSAQRLRGPCRELHRAPGPAGTHATPSGGVTGTLPSDDRAGTRARGGRGDLP